MECQRSRSTSHGSETPGTPELLDSQDTIYPWIDECAVDDPSEEDEPEDDDLISLKNTLTNAVAYPLCRILCWMISILYHLLEVLSRPLRWYLWNPIFRPLTREVSPTWLLPFILVATISGMIAYWAHNAYFLKRGVCSISSQTSIPSGECN